MRPVRPLPCLLLAAALLLSVDRPAVAAQPVLPGPIPAEVLEVLDGDTLTVRAVIWLGQSVETRVRIDGIDAPEMRSRCPREKDMAEAAREAARRLLGTGMVQLLDVQPDKYGGRVRARVLVPGGGDLSDLLLKAGMVRPYHGEHRQPWCGTAEQG